MTLTVQLPHADGSWQSYRLSERSAFPRTSPPAQSRVAFAAAHIVADPLAAHAPGLPTRLDWGATLAFRHHLWGLGLGVAEAMDTAQRGMGLDGDAARELIRRSAAEAQTVGGMIACGAGTDQLMPGRGEAEPSPLRQDAFAGFTLEDVIAAYLEQCAFIENCGGRIILMASRALASIARDGDEYEQVYDAVLSQVREPVILHWLGAMFDPQLAGYWGSPDIPTAMETVLRIIARHRSQIDGIKVSLLDVAHEVSLRRRLPPGVRLYTGDDFHYPDLIAGDNQGHSDALLGIFAAIAPAAAAALQALDAGQLDRYRAIFSPTVPLARHIFQAPTYYYKTGITFLAYLNGHQAHMRMVAGQESARSLIHLADLFRLADGAGLLRDPDLAAHRMQRVLALSGFV